MKNTIELTYASFELLRALVKDASNWSGSPMLNITKEQRGNLTNLKRNILLRTFTDEGCEYAVFANGTFHVSCGEVVFSFSCVECTFGSNVQEINP